MPQVSINKNNVFWNFAKILALLDENPQIKLTYSVDGESDRDELEKVSTRWAFGREKPTFSRDKASSFGDRRTSAFWEKKPFTKGKTFTKRESFDSVDDDSFKKPTTRKTPAYKSTKFKAEKRWTAPEVTNKKWNAGKWYKRAWY